MKVAVCLCDNNGMLFNSRRQSRDKTLIEDFVKTAKNSRILIKPFSAKLFENYATEICEDFSTTALEDDYCFIEDESVIPYSDKIQELIIYKWNRKYPSDFYFEMPDGFFLNETTEFKGNSHEKITKEVYIK